jgi:hypothetical protein
MMNIMDRRSAVLAMLTLPFGVRAGRVLGPAAAAQERWTPLFNGRDLASWDTYLGKPYKLSEVHGQPRNDAGEYTQPLGLNTDPKRAEYDNYHLRFEFKWGEKRWPPREQAVRDSGCCYHSTGPYGASYGFWLQSFEFQIQERDCGDFYGLAGVIADSEALRKDPSDPASDPVYRKGAPRIVGLTKRIIKHPDNERPTGQWNTVELYCLGATSVHVVNGVSNLILTGLRHKVSGAEAPLTKGRIQLQSEGSEVFYRNIAVRPISEIPASVRG